MTKPTVGAITIISAFLVTLILAWWTGYLLHGLLTNLPEPKPEPVSERRWHGHDWAEYAEMKDIHIPDDNFIDGP